MSCSITISGWKSEDIKIEGSEWIISITSHGLLEMERPPELNIGCMTLEPVWNLREKLLSIPEKNGVRDPNSVRKIMKDMSNQKFNTGYYVFE